MTSLDRRHFIAGALAASTFGAVRSAFAQAPTGPHSLPALKYAGGALEPHIDARTMEIHHGRHHQAYVNNLNTALKDHGQLAQLPLRELIARLAEVPESIRTAVRNNGGGHANHAMFWEIMGATSGNPSGDLAAAIDRDFGGLDKLKEQFNGAGARVFGSGWVFVTVDRDGKLAIAARPNQDTPLMEGQRVLIGNDVWEHAYYLKYQNRRADYLAAWWNVVDWSVVGTRYAAAKAGTLEI
jgi:Fe-Mn family superoxide dismutase